MRVRPLLIACTPSVFQLRQLTSPIWNCLQPLSSLKSPQVKHRRLQIAGRLAIENYVSFVISWRKSGGKKLTRPNGNLKTDLPAGKRNSVVVGDWWWNFQTESVPSDFVNITIVAAGSKRSTHRDIRACTVALSRSRQSAFRFVQCRSVLSRSSRLPTILSLSTVR